jgi:hypothetical protein
MVFAFVVSVLLGADRNEALTLNEEHGVGAVDTVPLPPGCTVSFVPGPGVSLVPNFDTLFVNAAGTPPTGCTSVLFMGFTIAAAMCLLFPCVFVPASRNSCSCNDLRWHSSKCQVVPGLPPSTTWHHLALGLVPA